MYWAHDQKRIQNWATKTWHQFTTTAVCDPSSKNIVAVINHSSISQWNLDEDDIEKVKRENFKTPIYQLIVSNGIVYVVFRNGVVEDLKTALQSHKQPKVGCLTEEDAITYAAIDGNIAVLLVQDEEKKQRIWKLDLEGKSPPISCRLVTEDASLVGICFHASKLFTLWSNGDMRYLSFPNDSLEKLPGRIYSTMTSIDPSKRVKMLPIASSHIAIVGCDVNHEGSRLLLWDMKFAIVTSSRKLKMYYSPPLAWVTPVGLIIVDGGPLTRTPYVITESNLATIMGSRLSEEAECPPEDCFGWDATIGFKLSATETIYCNKSDELVKVLRNIEQPSLSESMLVGTVIDILIKEKNLRLLHEVMVVFEDIPEAYLIKVLQCYLGCKDSSFEGLFKYPAMQMEVKNKEEVVKCPFGVGKASFIKSVLAKPYTDVLLTKELQKLSFDETLCLIQYLYFLISVGEVLLWPQEKDLDLSLGEVSEWMSLLLDTKYHELIMTSEMDTHRLLLSCFTKIADMRTILQEIIALEPLIEKVMEEGENTKCNEDLSCSGYSLEKLVITR